MTDPTPLDLDAIRARSDARRDYADERPESLHVPEDYAALADESAADVPALVEEVKRLRPESQRFYENRNLWQKRAEKAEAEVARLREKIDVDRAMHEAFRPEVVAEVAVPVCDEMDWQAVADWCGGTIDSAQDPSGEYTSSIAIPGVGEAYQGTWIVQRHDLTFAVRATLDGPSAESVARLTARPAPAWDEEATAEAVRKDLEAAGILPWTNGGARIVRTVLAVVREHLS